MPRTLANLLLGFAPAGGGGSSPPAAPTLSVADNGDGTGAIATISGSDGGTSNEVYTSPVIGGIGGLTETGFGPRSGDGTVALSLADGYYVAYVVSTLSGVYSISNLDTFFVTGGAVSNASYHWGLVQAVAATLQAMVPARLPGILSTSIRPRKVPSFLDFTSQSPIPLDKSFAFPGIVVCYWDKEVVGDYSNVDDVYGYPILVVFAVKDADPEQGDDQYLGWRQQVILKLIHQTFTITNPAAEFFNAVVEPGPILDWTRFQGEGVVAGSIGFRFQLRNTRG